MPRTLLLADDSVTIQKVVGISFANEDLQLVTVDNGDDAIARARETRPDIVLADVVMPGLSGYEVCEAIKRDPELAATPVLLLTGTFEAFDEARAQQAGADGHITKPFEAQALVDEVNERLAAVASAPAPSDAAAEVADPLAPATSSAASDDAYDFFDESAGTSDAEVAAAPVTPATTTLLLGDDAAAAASADPAVDDAFASAETAPPAEPVAEASLEPVDAGADDPIVAPVADADVPEIEPAGGESLPPIDAPFDANEPSEPLVSVDDEPFAPAADAGFASSSSATTPYADPVTGGDPLGDDPQGDAVTGDDPLAAPPMDDPLSEDATRSLDALGGAAPDDFDPLGDSSPDALGASDPLASPAEGSVLDPAGSRDYDVSSSDLGDSFTRSLSAPPVAPEPQADTDPFAGFDAPGDADDSDPGPFANPLAAETGLEAEPVLGDPDAEPEARPAALALDAPVTESASPLALGREDLHDALEKVAWEAFGDVTERIVKDAVARIEQVAWEVIPQMAESLIREEIRRLKGEDE